MNVRWCKVCLVLFAVLALLGANLRAEERRIVLGAGCFWCVESVFEQLPGVIDVVSGYAGGTTENPSYKEVVAGRTGHAEVVQISYDPAKTSLEKLLEVFWKSHDITDPRGVWPDFGPQYRSIILYGSEEERVIVEKSKASAQQTVEKPIATEISMLKKFYPAEDYHQDYVRQNPNDTYVTRVAQPKLKKLGLKVPEEKK